MASFQAFTVPIMSVTSSPAAEQATTSASPSAQSASASAPFGSGHANQAFVKNRLPAWFRDAPKPLRRALRDSLRYSQFSRRTLEAIRSRLKPVESFATPLLQQALFKRFDLHLDVTGYQLVTMRYQESALIRERRPYKQTLLQAALQNFDESEATEGSFEPGSALLPLGGLRLSLTEGTGVDGRYPRFQYEYQGILDIKPEQFAQLCHSLDLGEKYQAHLDTVFLPPTPAGQPQGSAELAVAKAFMDGERNVLEILAHIAMMKKAVSASAYGMLLQLTRPNGDPRWDGHPVRYRQLHMLKVPEFEGSVLYGALLIELDIPDVENGPCVLYLPTEPESPLKEYPSLMAVLVMLRRKLATPVYQQYFRRFVSLRNSAGFFARLDERLMPLGRVPGEPFLSTRRERRFNPAADLVLEAQDVGMPPFEMLFEHLKSKTYDDSRVIAVPSQDVDRQARLARMRGLEALGLDLLNAAGFFVPVLGEIMAVAAAGQLLHEAYIAVEEWNEGDLEEATDHLFDIAENLAAATALGAAGVKPGVEPSVFVESLVPLKLGNGQTRLWRPALEAFAHDRALPAGRPDVQGRIEEKAQNWLPLGGDVYRIELDTKLNKWRLKHPGNAQAYSPVIEHSGAGAWRSEFENPMGWDEMKAFRRLGVLENSLPDQTVQWALRSTGADDALLRQVHTGGHRPAALLRDCTRRLSIDQEIGQVNALLRSGHHQSILAPRIDPWLKCLATAPRWPIRRRLRLLDAQGGESASWGESAASSLPSIDVTWRAHDMDGLLGAIVDALQPDELDLLLDSGVSERPDRIKRLARYMAERAQAQRGRLFDELYEQENQSADPLVSLVRRDFPGLPVVVCEELLGTANSTQRERMVTSARLPLELAEHAREYLQQLRLNRANEGFYLPFTHNPDTLKTGLHVLELLPGWPQGIAIELRQGSEGGELLDSLGTDSTVVTRRVIVKTQTGYQHIDSAGRLAGLADGTFFTALLGVLPTSVLTDAGLAPGASEAVLRTLLGDLAASRREKVAAALGLQAIKPGFKWPQRLGDGRVGYPMSGRLRRLFGRLGLRASRYSPELAVKGLFPAFQESEVRVFLDDLGREYTGSASGLKAFIRQRCESLEAEYQTLNTTLLSWVAEAPEFSVVHSSRLIAAGRIRSCWKRLSGRRFSASGEVLGYTLDLSSLATVSYPVLTARFDHVVHLSLDYLYLRAEQLDPLLRQFANLTYLSLSNNHLTTVPAQVGAMSGLERLSLAHNPLRLDAQGVAHLQNLRRLHSLDLGFCPLGPDLDLSGLNPLKRLSLRSTGLDRVPEWIWRWIDLVRLDLRDNRITELSEQLLRNLARSGIHVQLHDNPLSEATLRHAEHGLNVHTRMRMGLGPERSHAAPQAAAAVAQWLDGVDDALLQTRRRHWSDLAAEPGSTDFFRVMRDLTQSADFTHDRPRLTQRVWSVIEAACADSELRQELFAVAAHPETCGDGVSIVFADLEIQILIFNAKATTSLARRPVELFKLARGLDRLDELEKIAQQDIAERLSNREIVDAAEVRLGYRVGLAAELELPAQPTKMLFTRLARLDSAKLAAAKERILAREATAPFMQSLTERTFWADFLEEYFAISFERIKTPFHERMLELDERKEQGLSDQQYLDQIALIASERRAAIQAEAIALSRRIEQEWVQDELSKIGKSTGM